MGLDRYDRYFGGVRGAAEKAKADMVRAYGRRDGEHVFLATVAKRKRKAKTAARGKWAPW